MPHELYRSLAEMLAPATLRELTGRPIHYVRCLPFKSEDSLSGNRFLKVVADDGRLACSTACPPRLTMPSSPVQRTGKGGPF